MKNKILTSIIVLLLMSSAGIKAQELAHYNLYIQNNFLYNAAYAIDGKGISAFVNSHIQWVGFDGAPRVNTFGIRGSITENSGLGLIVISNKTGVLNNFTTNLNYAFRGKFSDEHYFQLGLGAGIMSDKLSGVNQYTDASDDLLTNETFNGTGFSSRIGGVYYLKGFEAQVIMPHIYRRKGLDLFSLGIVSYNYQVNESWDLKPSVLIKGEGTTPQQGDINLMGMWSKTIWAQAGYRTNKSLIIGLGFNFKGFGLGYAYQTNSKELANASGGTHEIQLIYGFGENMLNKPKKSTINGKVINASDNTPVSAGIKVSDEQGKEIATTSSNENGEFNVNLKQGATYNLDINAEGFYPVTELLTVEDNETANVDKVFNFKIIPTKAKVSGFVLREDNNSPLSAEIKIYENGALLEDIKTDASKGNFTAKLKSGKKYEFEVSSENCITQKIIVDIAEKETNKTVNINLVHNAVITSNVTDNKTNEQISYNLNIYKEGNLIKTSSENSFSKIYLEKGSKYTFEYKAADYLTHKEDIDLTSGKTEITKNIKLEKISKESFSLGTIEFKTGTAELTDVSFETLDKLVLLMQQNPELSVEIGGHTDDVGANQVNQSISEKRAKACLAYVISKGINSNRIIAKGYGESKPLVPNDSPENKAKNRRVEFKFID